MKSKAKKIMKRKMNQCMMKNKVKRKLRYKNKTNQMLLKKRIKQLISSNFKIHLLKKRQKDTKDRVRNKKISCFVVNVFGLASFLKLDWVALLI